MADFTAQQRHDMAMAGQAMSDGSYPIRNRQDLARAVMALGRANDPQAVKRWIIKRARELNALDMLPQSWGVR